MKQVKFIGQSFSQIIKTVEGIRGNGDIPKLAKIYYRVKNGYITLQCCNGYIAVKLLFPYIGKSEKFEGWFDYIAIEKDVQEVTLSQRKTETRSYHTRRTDVMSRGFFPAVILRSSMLMNCTDKIALRRSSLIPIC